MSSRTTLFVLIGLMAAHLVLAICFASATPWRQSGFLALSRSVIQDIGAPDERQHANYIMRLANGEGFPVFNPQDPQLYESYQSHQPPAYYLLAAGWSKATMASPVDAKETGFKLRFLNCLLGAATVAGVFFLVLWGFRRPEAALAAAAFAALLPMMVGLSGAVSNDPLLIALCTWVLALCGRGIREGWTWKLVVLVGVLTGVAVMTKTTAVALFPALLAAALVPQTRKPSLAMAGALVGIALVAAGPWWVRNQSLYGDPLAMKAFTEAFQGSMQKETVVSNLAKHGDTNAELSYWKDGVGWWTARSFFGAFGYMDIWLNESTLPENPEDKNLLYRLLMGGFLVLGVAWAFASFKSDLHSEWGLQVVNGVFLLVILLLFLRFNSQYFQAQARYLLPAIGSIASGLGLGIAYLMRKRSSLAWVPIALVLGIVNLYALTVVPAAFEARVEAAKQVR